MNCFNYKSVDSRQGSQPKNFKKQIKKDSQNKSVYKEIFSINTSMKVLLGKHLMIEFVKK